MSQLTNSNPLAAAGSLDDFQPRAKPAPDVQKSPEEQAEKAITRQIATERGFVIDNLAGSVVRAKRSANTKASKSHTLRLYIHDLNRFQTWCNEHDYSQARGFEILLDKLLAE